MRRSGTQPRTDRRPDDGGLPRFSEREKINKGLVGFEGLDTHAQNFAPPPTIPFASAAAAAGWRSFSSAPWVHGAVYLTLVFH
ncbi:hypothetical protein NL676_006866 [Syzygium grande]|nr:hypothetical protein NL676_006866 [Syzygium grande]